MKHLPLIVGLIALVFVACARAQTAPTTAPERHVLTIPPGFGKVEGDGWTVICEPADEKWVRSVLTSVNPRPHPTTMPADMIAAANVHRQELAARMVSELGADPNAANEFFDKTLLAELTKLRDFKPPLFFLVATREKIKEALTNGWTDPRYHYNRVADDIMIDDNIGLSTENMSDALIPVFHKSEEDTPARAGRLAGQIVDVDEAIANALSQRAAAVTQSSFETFIGTKIIEPLALKPDQSWLGMGIGGIYSARYTSPVIGVDARTIIDAMTYEDPRSFLKISAIDLLHPVDPQNLRSETAPYYLGTAHRKSMVAIDFLMKQAGDAAILKVLNAVKQSKPADGPALVKLIQEQTQVDLAKKLTD
jgi:hypothetical protein